MLQMQEVGPDQSDCPHIKDSRKKSKRRAMLEAWEETDESSSKNDSDLEVANLCLMANEDSVVNSSTDFDEQFSYEELKYAFEELHLFKKLVSKNRALKKTISSLLIEIKKWNDELKTKIEDIYCTNDISNDLKFENEELKKKVESLNESLSKFVQGKENLENKMYF